MNDYFGGYLLERPICGQYYFVFGMINSFSTRVRYPVLYRIENDRLIQGPVFAFEFHLDDKLGKSFVRPTDEIEKQVQQLIKSLEAAEVLSK